MRKREGDGLAKTQDPLAQPRGILAGAGGHPVELPPSFDLPPVEELSQDFIALQHEARAIPKRLGLREIEAAQSLPSFSPSSRPARARAHMRPRVVTYSQSFQGGWSPR